jgi:hypothetical protein
MSRPEILALALLGLIAVFFGPMWLRAAARALKRPQAIVCTECGTQIHPSYGTRCAACVTRANAITSAWAEFEIEQSRRQRAIDAERREAARIAARAEVLVVGSVSADPHGSVTFDGWQFGALPGMEPGRVVPLQGRISPTALIAGWKQSEMHVLAHGEHCTCLSRTGAWVR